MAFHGPGDAAECRAARPGGAQPDSPHRIRHATCLQHFMPMEVLEIFPAATEDDGTITPAAFKDCFAEIAGCVAAERSLNEDDAYKLVVSSLYGLFDSDGNGVVDFMELSSGLTVLCGGDCDSKIEAALAVFDYSGDRVIPLEKMARYLTSVFKVMFRAKALTEARLKISVEDLALATAEQAFMEADLDADGNLSFEEFKLWYAEAGLLALCFDKAATDVGAAQ